MWTRNDKRAAAAVALDHTVGNKHVECRAYGEAADAELLGQFFVGWDLIANAPVTVSKAGAEGLEDLEIGWETHAAGWLVDGVLAFCHFVRTIASGLR